MMGPMVVPKELNACDKLSRLDAVRSGEGVAGRVDPDTPLIVDAGIGLPSHAAAAMELGYDAVLLNTSVAKAGDPVAMARAFAGAVEAGRTAYLAGPMEARDMAAPSTPVFGKPVLAR